MEEPIEVSVEMARMLKALGIEYLVGGSFASSLHGHPRSTQDIDIVADLRPEHITPLLATLHERFYFDEPAIREAVSRRSSFNVIHLRTLFKVDIFVAGDDLSTRLELQRRQVYTLDIDPPEDIIVASPEDVIVQKLHWYRLGDHISERQWLDAMNILEVRGSELDHEYMRDLATHMGVSDLLQRILTQAGLGE
ncbi:MAG TPA: hypothetical protein VF006_24995 [Longimicrobium sp.]